MATRSTSLATELDIHARATRIIRGGREGNDDRKTLVCVTSSRQSGCRSCASPLDHDAQYCGMCGGRARMRSSLTGTVVDELYAVEDRLAEGETATIYRARYLPSGQEIALKVLHPELVYDALALARFRREGRSLARLRDAHTVAVYDHGEDPGVAVYIAMELLRGEGLDVRLRTRGAMPWRDALAIMRAVCSSLVEAHANGIVHRDLSPRTIRLGAGDHVKVIDFGRAKVRPDADEELTFAGEAVGSLQYMAPEQIVGRACDGRADLYALGVITLELILGHVRRPGATAALVPTEIPREVQRLLERCLAADPANRVPNATELAREIDTILVPAAAVTPVQKVSHRLAFAHTSAFELQPPRIVIDLATRDTEVDARPATRGRWKLWAVALLVCGIGLGTAVAGCV